MNKNKNIKIVVSDKISLKDSSRIRQKRKGFKKFMVETLTGWFKGGDIKFKEGVHQLRNINREKDKYDHVVRDKRTGKIIHEEHEKLSDHKND